MAYSSARSIEGPKKKVRRKRPTTSTVTATLGGEGQRRTERAARRAERPPRQTASREPSARATLGGEDVRGAKPKVVRRRKRERREDAALERFLASANDAAKYARLTERRFDRRLENQIRRGEVTLSDDDDSFAERLVAGGVLGLVDEQASADVRRAIYGTESPSAATLALSALPVARAAKLVGRGVSAIKGAKAASAGQKVPAGSIESKLSALGRSRVKRGKPGRVRKVPRSKAEAKANAKSAYKAHKPSVLTKPGRQVKRRQRAAGIAQAGALSGGAAAVPASILTTTGEAIVEDIKEGKPLRTVGTTARVLPGLAAGVIGTGADIGATGKRAIEKAAGRDISWENVLDPVEGELEAQKGYWETVARISEGDTEAVQEELGLVPVLSGGLVAAALGKTVARPKGKPTASERLQEQRASPDRQTQLRARRKIDKRAEKGPGIRQGHEGRASAAQRAGVTGERTRAIYEAEMKTPGRGKRRIDKRMERLARKPIAEGVSLADTVQVLGRRGIDLDADPAVVVGRLRTYRESLRDPSAEIDDLDPSTRPVLAALIREVERNPDVLKDADLRGALSGIERIQHTDPDSRQVERGQERGIEGPDPDDEVPRLMYAADELGIRPPSERISPRARELTGEESVDGARRVLADKIAKAKKARSELQKARQKSREFEARAKGTPKLTRGKRRVFTAGRGEVVKEKPRQLIHRDRAAAEAKAEEFSDIADAYSRDFKRNVAEGKEISRALSAVPGRFRRAEANEHRADELELEGRLDEADGLRAAAQQERATAINANAALRDEFISETLDAIEQTPGFRQPIYMRELDISDKGRLNVLTDYPGGQVPAKGKRRGGILSAEGRIDEAGATLIHNLAANRRGIEQRRMWKDLVDETRLEVGGNGIFTGPAIRKLEREGRIPRGYKPVATQAFERVLARGKWDEAAGLMDDALMADIRAGKREPGRKYALLPEAEIRELRAQMEGPGGFVKGVRTLNFIQSAAMLATSPAWFSFQLVASPFAALVHNTNPVDWARAAKFGLTEWRKLSPKQKAAFRSNFGGTSSDVLMRRQTATSLEPDSVRDMASAMTVATKTPAGRLLRGVGMHLRRGGPLMAANRRYEAGIRTALGVVEMQKVARSPRATKFVRSLARLTDTVDADLKAVAKLPGADQARYYARHPGKAKVIGNRVRSALGDWVSLSSRERGLAAVSVFYPFLRFSLKWAFVSTPRNHPIKSMILLNLAQQNAQELDQILGGDPSFFTKWGIAVTHTGEDGEAIKGIETHRFNPGGNALVEALGGGDLNLATLTRPLQPVFATALSAAQQYDPFTGEPTDEPRTTLVGRQLLGLSPLTRPVAEEVRGERSAVSQLFDQIAGKERTLAEGLVPQVLTDLRAERTAAGVGRLLDATEEPDVSQIIRDVIAPAADPVRAAKRAGKSTASKILAAQKAKDELQRILEAEGLGEDAAMGEAIDEFFSLVTPAQFGNKPAKKVRLKQGGAFAQTFGGEGGGWYGKQKGGGGGAFESVFGAGAGSQSGGGGSSQGGAFESVFGKSSGGGWYD